MTTFTTLRQQAATFRAKKQFQEALPLYRQIWSNHREECGESEAWGYAFCLLRLRLDEEALKCCRESYPQWPNSEPLNDRYAWAIYRTTIKNKEADETALLKAARAILQLCKPGPYTPYALTVLRMMELLAKQANYNAKAILAWAEKIQPEALDNKSFSFKMDDGKERPIASLRERYYAVYLRALLKTERYEDCIQTAEKAIVDIPKFHYNNDLWFRRLAAKSHLALGQTQQARHLYEFILTRNRAWFLLNELAQIQFDSKQFTTALSLAVESALAPEETQKKVKSLQLLGQWLLDANLREEARQHLAIVCKIRLAHNWQFSEGLVLLAEKLEVNLDTPETYQQLYQQMRPLWTTLAFEFGESQKGKIITLFPNRKGGFLRGKDGRTCFFSAAAFRSEKRLMQIGQEVEFITATGFDAKKRQESTIAIHIRKREK